MRTKKNTTKRRSVDPDDAPHLDREWFESADLYRGNQLVRRGRPKSTSPKKAVSLRLDPDVLKHFRSEGPGWQSRINAVLRKAAKLRP
jgi:uncharacterized protein (DUF4415 family)